MAPSPDLAHKEVVSSLGRYDLRQYRGLGSRLLHQASHPFHSTLLSSHPCCSFLPLLTYSYCRRARYLQWGKSGQLEFSKGWKFVLAWKLWPSHPLHLITLGDSQVVSHSNTSEAEDCIVSKARWRQVYLVYYGHQTTSETLGIFLMTVSKVMVLEYKILILLQGNWFTAVTYSLWAGLFHSSREEKKEFQNTKMLLELFKSWCKADSKCCIWNYLTFQYLLHFKYLKTESGVWTIKQLMISDCEVEYS